MFKVGLSKNLEGSDIQVVRNDQAAASNGGKFTVGEMYFSLPVLASKLDQTGKVTKDGEKKLLRYVCG